MPSIYASLNDVGLYREYVGENGVNDNDICIETTDISRYDTFMLSCSTGSVQVFLWDGQNWQTSPLSLSDLGATDQNPVLGTSALRQYGFRGNYQKLKVQQNGASAATNVVLRCAKYG